jgi:hypothetical protein
VRDERVDVALVVGDILQGPTEHTGRGVVAALGPRALRQGGRQPLLEPSDPCSLERGQDDLDQPVVLAVAVRGDRLEHPVGEPHRIGGGLGGDSTEIAAGLAEHVADIAAAVVDAIEDRLGQLQESPQQLERQIGAAVGHLVEDQLALQVEVLHEGRPLLPVDEGPRLAQRGKPLADVGGGRLGAGLGVELEPEPPFGGCIPLAKLEEDLGQPLGAEGLEFGEVDRLLRCHPSTVPRARRGRSLHRGRRP